jgi:tetratricopeptide (TPR) repeat protein
MIVLPLAVAMTASLILKSVAWQKPALAVAGSAAVIGLVVCTRNYLWTWQNTRTLFERSLAVTKKNAFAHNNLAAYLLEHYDYDGAIEHALTALQIVPTYPDPHDTLCFAYTQKSTVTDDRAWDLKAIPEYEKVLSNEAGHTVETLSLIRNGFGTSLARTGHLVEASEQFRKCTEMNPTLPEGHCNLGMSLNNLGRYAEAAAEFREALRLRPGYDTARSMLERALAELNQGSKTN